MRCDKRYRNSVPERHSVSTAASFDKKRKAHRDNMVAQSSKEGHKRKLARAGKHSNGGNKSKGGGGGADNGDADGWTLVT